MINRESYWNKLCALRAHTVILFWPRSVHATIHHVSECILVYERHLKLNGSKTAARNFPPTRSFHPQRFPAQVVAVLCPQLLSPAVSPILSSPTGQPSQRYLQKLPSPGRGAQLVTVSSCCAKVVSLIPCRGVQAEQQIPVSLSLSPRL